jgi:hypothetical protein
MMVEIAARIQHWADGSAPCLHLCAGSEDQDANPVCATFSFCQEEAAQLADFLKALGHVDTAEDIRALIDELPGAAAPLTAPAELAPVHGHACGPDQRSTFECAE